MKSGSALSNKPTPADTAPGQAGGVEPLDVVVLLTLAFFACTQTADAAMISRKLGLQSQVTRNVLGGALNSIAMLLTFVFLKLMFMAPTAVVRRLKVLIVLIFIAIYVVVPTLDDVVARASLGLRDVAGRQVSVAHDGGVIQTEGAIEFLLSGKNPYGADYHGTAMEESVDSDPRIWEPLGLKENPGLMFYAYPPGTFLYSTPAYLAGKWLFGFYDQRLLQLAALLALAWMAYALPDAWPWKLALLTLLALSPLSTFYFTLGMNDVLCLTAVVAGVLFMKRQRPRTAAVMLGLACGLKQYAWVLLPFYLALLYLRSSGSGRHRVAQVTRQAWPLALVLLLTMGPFLVWDARAFLHDLLATGAQGKVFPFREQTLGIENFLYLFGIVTHHREAVTLWPWQLLAVGVLLAIGLRRLVRQPRLAVMLAWYAAALLAMLFFSRFARNHYAYVFSIMTLAIALAAEPVKSRE